MSIFKELRQAGYDVWYDMEEDNLAAEGMEEGVSRCRVVLIFLSDGYTSRPFCQKEVGCGSLRRLPGLLRSYPLLLDGLLHHASFLCFALVLRSCASFLWFVRVLHRVLLLCHSLLSFAATSRIAAPCILSKSCCGPQLRWAKMYGCTLVGVVETDTRHGPADFGLEARRAPADLKHVLNDVEFQPYRRRNFEARWVGAGNSAHHQLQSCALLCLRRAAEF